MNKLTLVLLLALLVTCGCEKKVDNVDNKQLIQESISVASSLDIRFEAQDVLKDGKRKVVMWLKNPTDKGFTATMQVYVLDHEQQVLHVETIPLGDIAAKGGTWKIFWVKPQYLSGCKIEFKWVSFKLKE